MKLVEIWLRIHYFQKYWNFIPKKKRNIFFFLKENKKIWWNIWEYVICQNGVLKINYLFNKTFVEVAKVLW